MKMCKLAVEKSIAFYNIVVIGQHVIVITIEKRTGKLLEKEQKEIKVNVVYGDKKLVDCMKTIIENRKKK